MCLIPVLSLTRHLKVVVSFAPFSSIYKFSNEGILTRSILTVILSLIILF